MKTILRIIPVLLIMSIVACEQVSGVVAPDAAKGPAAWIDAPLDNSNLPQVEYQVVSHASDPGGISSFELSVNGKVIRTDAAPGDQTGKSISHISQSWLPPAPGTYLLEVRAKNINGAFGPSASANVTVGGVRQITPTVEASATLVFTTTVTPTSTPTSSTTPIAVGLQNTNCHSGPGVVYDVSGVLAKNQGVQIEGVNSEKTWVWVRHPNLKGNYCWLSISFVRIQGSLDGLRVILAPPLPTLVPTATINHH